MPKTIENLQEEIWSIISFQKETKSREYYISNKGRLKSVEKLSKNERIMKTALTKRGYPKVSLKLEGGYESVYIHKAVGDHFVPKDKEDFTYLIHKDFNRSNNTSQNLKWVSEDQQKAYIKERGIVFDYKKSTGGGYFKLTAGQVAIIKKALINGKTRKKMLAKRFGVTSTQIKRIERGENWAHVPPAE